MNKDDKFRSLKEHIDKHLKNYDPTPRYWPYTSNQRKTCMSYWFPRIKHLPVPRTVILQTDLMDADIGDLMEGRKPERLLAIVEQLKTIIKTSFEYPIFLRTGMTSAKHEWKDTCFVESEDQLCDHVFSIVTFSMLCDFCGLPCDVWVIREFLELDWFFKAFEDMPIAVEVRFFVGKGRIMHEQPYWPVHAFERHIPKRSDWLELLKKMSFLEEEEMLKARELALKVADVFKDDGSYSVDVCRLKSGEWYITDMAVGDDSYKYDFASDSFDEFVMEGINK